jgi:Glycosyl hydrolase family 79, N-terminal domain
MADPSVFAPTLYVARLRRVGTVHPCFQSYNVEMIEVTGGRFWKPYAGWVSDAKDRYQYRPPLDLGNPRLRRLAAALGPALMRVSGTWANKTAFDGGDSQPAAPPAGFDCVLTHCQWQGVVDFAVAVDAKITTSMAVSTGTRDASGHWQPDMARRFFEFNRSIGGQIVAAEFMNEPTAPFLAGVPKGWGASDYARDFLAFRTFAHDVAPQMLVLGPGSVGEAHGKEGDLTTRHLLQASSPAVDVFSYHHYGAASLRCADGDWWPQTSRSAALSEDWLATTTRGFKCYGALRDAFEPRTPIWLTETADAVCGGNPWAKTFLDSFRYLDQLGRLAKAGVQVVMHNTLAASDYGLLDENSFLPRPNYWAALLWRRLMGDAVFDAGIAPEGLHIYVHGRRDQGDSVAVLVLNLDRKTERSFALTVPSQRYTLTAEPLDGCDIRMNGTPLRLTADDALPALDGLSIPAGPILFPPASITFLATAAC